ncbi:hypothetical protein F4777DRAFT_423775 [Nemania sp. FL0916]|nr:hypothetical protein F4777DRAFT_423775 [Nemania sp. FL0916]
MIYTRLTHACLTYLLNLLSEVLSYVIVVGKTRGRYLLSHRPRQRREIACCRSDQLSKLANYKTPACPSQAYHAVMGSTRDGRGGKMSKCASHVVKCRRGRVRHNVHTCILTVLTKYYGR